jgi:hypothetical protein
VFFEHMAERVAWQVELSISGIVMEIISRKFPRIVVPFSLKDRLMKPIAERPVEALYSPVDSA